MDLGVAHLNALELPPEMLVPAVARAGFRATGLRINPVAEGGLCYPLPPGSDALRRVRALLRDEGVRVNEVEFIQVTPDLDPSAFAPMLETGAELGATCLTVAGEDPDAGRLTANFAALCDLAAPFGIRVDVEFMAWRVVATIRDATRLVTAADRPNGGILMDSLHLARSGGTPADIAATPAAQVRAAQICDAPATPPSGVAGLIAEARESRLPPGEGALPLHDFLRALPPGTAISAEVPMPGLDAATRLRRAYEATVRVMTAASWPG
ncbi:MAG TPA: sugar phosphate isomerase/epimerase [Rhodopila sp.]|uniref:sugar phosphate isomerase/epimerase family protein n=1 Tax=Rhodopila sp. TaxID=2480087 RepID=UPI002C5EAD03|nr:sugar phosphate isomerase/epimerase [Rhodopila sp.]HVY16634.1 sugar phosphate isomerase/epimerase [Rhodopila sp.]